MKAADIPDEEFLFAVAWVQWGGGMWALFTEVEEVLVGYPWKVMRAKARRLLDRGLMTGCACGCRGDFEITDAGVKVLVDELILFEVTEPPLTRLTGAANRV